MANSFTVTARFLADISQYVQGQTAMVRSNAKVAASVKDMQTAVERVQRAAEGLSDSLDSVLDSQTKVSAATKRTSESLRAQGVAAKKAAETHGNFADETTKVTSSLKKMADALKASQDKLGRTNEGRFARGVSQDASKATAALKVFGLAAAGAGAAYLAMNRQARTATFSAVSSGAAKLVRELRDLPGTARKVSDGLARIKDASSRVFDSLAGPAEKAKKILNSVIAESSRVGKTVASVTMPFVQQRGVLGALGGATMSLYGSVGVLAQNYGKLDRALDVATGGLSKQIKALASGKASIADIMQATEAAQRQVRRFNAARQVEADRVEEQRKKVRKRSGADPSSPFVPNREEAAELARIDSANSRNKIAQRAARDVVIMNTVGAGFGKIKTWVTNLGRANDEMGRSLGGVERARKAYHDLFNVAGGVALAVGLQRVTAATVGFVRSTLNAGARSKELDVVLHRLGESAGYTETQLKKQVDAMKEAGIETKAAKDALADFIKVQIPVGNAEKLSKVARDFAVLAGSDTSQTFQNIVYGIASRQTDVLRTAGVQVSFEQSFAKYASAMGKSVSDLTEAEKTQAGLNAVLEAGVTVAGAYEEAMGTAGKQLRSTKRYVEEIRNSLGTQLEPAFASAVKIINDLVKPGSKIAEMAKSTGLLGKAFQQMGNTAKTVLDGVHDRLMAVMDGFNPNQIATFVKSFADNAGGVVASLLPAGMAVLAKQIAGFLPLIGDLAQRIGGWQVAVAAIVLSNKDLRAALGQLIGDLAKAAAVLSAALLPLFNELVKFFEDNSDALSGLAKDLGEVAMMAAKMGAVVAKAAMGPLKLLLEVLSGILRLLDSTNALSGLLVAFTAFKAFDKFKGWADSIDRTSSAMGKLKGAMSGISNIKDAWKATDVGGAVAAQVSDVSRYYPGAVQSGAAAAQTAANAKVANQTAAVQGAASSATRSSALFRNAQEAAASTSALKALGQSYSEVGFEATRAGGRAAKAFAGVRESMSAMKSSTQAWAASLDQPTRAALKMVAAFVLLEVAFMAYSKLQEREAKRQAKVMDDMDKAYRKTLKTDGQTAAFGQQIKAIDRLKVKFEEAEAARKKVTQQDGFSLDGLKDLALSTGGMGGVNPFAPLIQKTAASGQTEDDLNNARKQLRGQVDEYTEGLGNYFVQLQDDVENSKKSVADSVMTINAVLKTNVEGIKNFNPRALTQAQTQQLENELQDLAAMSNNWLMSYTSLSSALARKEVKDLPTLMGHYREIKNRTEWFLNDLKTLQEAGLPKDMIMDLMAAGPQAAGDEVAKWRKVLDDAGKEGSASAIGYVKSTITEMKMMVETANREMAQLWLSTGEMTKNMTPEMTANLAQSAAGMRDQLTGALSSLDPLGASLQAIDAANSVDLSGPIAAYQGAMAQFINIINSGVSTAEDRSAAMANALQAAVQIKKLDPDASAILDLGQGIMTQIMQLYPSLETAMGQLGLSMTDSLAVGLTAGVPALQQRLDQIMLYVQGMVGQLINSVNQGWGNITEVASGIGQAVVRGLGQRAKAQIEYEMVAKTTTDKPADPRSGEGTQGGTDVYSKMAEQQALAQRGADAQQAMADAGANLAKQLEEIRKQVTEANPPLSLFDEALEKLYGNARNFQASVDGSAAAAEDMARTLIQLSASTDSPIRKQRALRSATDQLVDSVKAETEAAIKAGKINNDVASVTNYFKTRVTELQQAMPRLVNEIKAGSNSIEDLRDAISAAQKTLDDGLEVRINLDEGIFAAEEAFDALEQRVKDQRSLLTGVYLTDKDRRAIYRDTVKELNNYTRALQGEARALAQSGKIGADAASIQKHVREGLMKAKAAYPELAEQIDAYLATLTEATKATEDAGNTKSELEIQVEQAILDIGEYQKVLDQIPMEAETILKVKIDEASKAAIEAYADQIAGIQSSLSDTGLPDPSESLPTVTMPKPPTGTAMDHYERMPSAERYLGGKIPASTTVPAVPQNLAKTIMDAAKGMAGLGKTNQSAVKTFQQLVDAASANAIEMASAGEISGDYATIQKAVIIQLEAAAREYPEITGMVRDYSNTVKSVEPSKMTSFKAETTGAQAAVGTYKQIVSAIPSSLTTTVSATVAGSDNLAWLASAINATTGTQTLTVTADTSQAVGEIMKLAAANLIAKGFAAGATQMHESAAAVGTTATSIIRGMWNRDSGGPLPPGEQLVRNMTGQDEWVLNPQQMRMVMKAARASSMPEAIRKLSMAPALQPSSGPSLGSMVATEPQGQRLDLQPLIDALRDSKGNVNISSLNVQSDEPPAGWLEEGLWRQVAPVS